MPINKVVYNRNTLIDLTNDTVSENTLFKGCTAHKSDGTIVTGKMFEGYPDKYSLYEPIQDRNGNNITDGLGDAIQGKTVYQKV